MNKEFIHELSEWATIAQAVLAALAAAVAYRQITVSQKESKKWKTLEACSQYESEPIISSAVRLRRFYENPVAQTAGSGQPPDGGHEPFRLVDDAKLVLNFFDGIAIGVQQNLYIESLARDHMANIVRVHVMEVFERKKFPIDASDYTRLIDMDYKWQRKMPYFTDSNKFIQFIKKPGFVASLIATIMAIFVVLAIYFGYNVSGSVPSRTPETPASTTMPK